MAGQTEVVQIVVAVGLCEFVATLKAVQTDDTLAGGQVALRQVFADHVDQIEHHRLADALLQLGGDCCPYLIDTVVVQTAWIAQQEHWTVVWVPGRWCYLQADADVLAVGVSANRRQHCCVDLSRNSAEIIRLLTPPLKILCTMYLLFVACDRHIFHQDGL